MITKYHFFLSFLYIIYQPNSGHIYLNDTEKHRYKISSAVNK